MKAVDSNLISRLSQDERGSVLVWLAFTFLLLFGSLALAVDLARVFVFQTRLDLAAEASSLIAAQNLYLLSEDNLFALAYEVARNKVEDNPFPSFTTAGVLLDDFSISKTDDDLGVEVSLKGKLPTTLLRSLNFFEDIEVQATAIAEMTFSKTELVMVMDSSLAVEASGKLSEIKAAATYVVGQFDRLVSAGKKIKLAIVPNANVFMNVAPNKGWVQSSDWPDEIIPPTVPGITMWSGPLENQRWCVGRRLGTAAMLPVTPIIEPFPLILAIDKEMGADGVNVFSVTTDANCGNSTIKSLSASLPGFSGYMADIDAAGVFARGRSFVWAERLLSPDWQGVWNADVDTPVDYGTDMRKVVLLLTGSGDTGNSQDELDFSESCERLKQLGMNVAILNYGGGVSTNAGYESCISAGGFYGTFDDSASFKSSVADFVKSLTSSRLTVLN
ncbi:MAG: Tad domain-containing protein [Sneathiella sp.]